MSTVLIVGASKAGCTLANQLARSGWQGRIQLVNGESVPPYDKPPLSKDLLTSERDSTDFPLLDPQAVADGLIEVIALGPALSLDPSAQTVSFRGGEELRYDHLVVATGASARQPFPGLPPGALTLRSFQDCQDLRTILRRPDAQLVIIGGGFIGFEVASSARQLGVDVTIVEVAKVPLIRGIGEQAGAYLTQVARDFGVDVRVQTSVTRFLSGDGDLVGVELSTGEVLDSDACVIGVGSSPNVNWLDGALPVSGGGIHCNRLGRVIGFDNVYAIGDVAAWGDEGDAVRHEHWTSAATQASVVARALQGDTDAKDALIYVWSDQFDRRVSVYGQTGGDLDSEEILLPGAEPEFAVGYFDGATLVGVCVVGPPREALKFRSLLLSGSTRSDLVAPAAAAAVR